MLFIIYASGVYRLWHSPSFLIVEHQTRGRITLGVSHLELFGQQPGAVSV